MIHLHPKMIIRSKQRMNLIKALSLLLLMSALNPVFAQYSIRGKILTTNGKRPVSNVSVGLSGSEKGALSDAAGNFRMSVDQLTNKDTLTISSIGFVTLKVPIQQAVKQSQFLLTEDSKNMDNIELKSYTSEASQGTISETTGYFYSWHTKQTGGELGRIMYVNSNDYKLERVRVKINNQCDTCLIRLHVRELDNGLPGEDLLKDSITITTNRLSFDDKFVEFDLRNNDVIIKKNKYVFVGFETLNCNSAIASSGCSLAYIGTEDGNFLYRNKGYNDWEESTMHSLYIRLFYKY